MSQQLINDLIFLTLVLPFARSKIRSSSEIDQVFKARKKSRAHGSSSSNLGPYFHF
jgi:hypothetical protein